MSLTPKPSTPAGLIEWASQFSLHENPTITWGFPYHFGDFLKYHSGPALCGLSLGFKLVQRLLEEGLGSIPKTGVTTRGAFGGKGMRDAFNYVFHPDDETGFTLDLETQVVVDCSKASSGAYAFEVTYPDGKFHLGIKPGVVRDEFLNAVHLRNEGKLHPDEVRILQWEMCQRVLPAPSTDICNVRKL